MASLALDPESGFYRIAFWYGGKQYRRSLRIKDERRAEGIRGRVEETLSLIQTGRLLVPPEADAGTFILSEGERDQKPVTVIMPQQPKTTIGDLIACYKEELPGGAKEPNSLRTERIHLRFPCSSGSSGRIHRSGDDHHLAAAQRYAKLWGRETHGKNVKRPIRPCTVRKELKSFRHV